jgi:Ni,Fe-hydrogenase maturation factor
VDGGLGGLNLIGLVEGAERIVFVDSVEGFGPTGQPVVLDAAALLEADAGRYRHGDGLAYLLRSIPAALEGEAPEIVVVGAQAPADDATIARLADCCVRIVAGGAIVGATAPR